MPGLLLRLAESCGNGTEIAVVDAPAGKGHLPRMGPHVWLALGQQHVECALARHQRHQHGGGPGHHAFGNEAAPSGFRSSSLRRAISGGAPCSLAARGAEFVLIETEAHEASPISAAFCMG